MNSFLFFIKKAMQRFLPPALKRLAERILLGDLSRFSVKSPKRFDWDDVDDAKKSILWVDNWDEATENTVQLMQNMGVVKAGGFVVDWGCGVGRIATILAKRRNITVLAVDRSVQMLRHALNYVQPTLGKIALVTDEFVLSHIDLFKERADLLCFIESFQHIPEPLLDQILPELKKLLKRDGKLFVFGNERLEIGYEYRNPPTIEEVIKRHFALEKSKVIFQSYSKRSANLVYGPRPRYSYVATLPKKKSPH